MAVTGMDRKEYLQKRRGRYLAQTLDHFELHIETLLPPGAATEDAVNRFKGLARARFNALAVDAIDLLKLEEEGAVQNPAAVDLRTQLSPTGPTH